MKIPLTSFQSRWPRSVSDADHRNASFIGSADKGFSRVLGRDVSMECIPARSDRCKILFAIVDGPASRQHICRIPEGRNTLVLFRPTHNEHQRGKLIECVPFHAVGSFHGKPIGNCAKTIPVEVAA